MTASAVLLAALVLALAVVLFMRRRRQHADDRVRLYDMMRRRGVSPPPAEDAVGARDVAAAERRCAACANKEMCDELLRVGQTQGYDRFCPNALYIEWLRSNSLDFELPPRSSADRPD